MVFAIRFIRQQFERTETRLGRFPAKKPPDMERFLFGYPIRILKCQWRQRE